MILSCPLPDVALLGCYRREGAFTDCYAVDCPRVVSLAEYVAAFYTTRVFKLERFILKWAVSLPSTDAQARQLAAGTTDTFAAWHVEHRLDDQLLLTDLRGRTRSWLMVVPLPKDSEVCTRLYFGSAVVPMKTPGTGSARLGAGFRALLGFHRVYSRMLLDAANSALKAESP